MRKEVVMTEQGGTVRYHRAEWRPENEMWAVQFPGNGRSVYFSAAEGAAMGLTPPEPAPLVVTCNGHSIELSDEEVEQAERVWSTYDDDQSSFDHAPLNRVKRKVARLLRDARQDPQPASEFRDDAGNVWSPGPGIRVDTDKWPIGVTFSTAAEPAVEPDTASDVDFDALPIGTVLALGPHALRVKVTDDQWAYIDRDDLMSTASLSRPDLYTIAYQPALLSPGECLRGLLAGRDDADELMAEALTWPNEAISEDPNDLLVSLIGDAAREVHGG